MMQPKLRFLGFKEEWHGSSLSKVFNFKNGYNASAGEYGHGVLFINVLDIINNNFITSNDIVGKVNISSEMLEKYSVKNGDILFQRSSETVEEVGQANVYLGEGIVSFGGFVIRGSKKTEDDSLFLNYLLKTSLVRRDIMKRAGGSTRYNIGQESLNEVMVYLPINIEEQAKIANFFSAVDQKITILEKQQQAWEQYKQGMMQKLFSGELRFKDDNGEDFPEWSELLIGELGDSAGGGTPSTKNTDYWQGEIPWISSSDLSDTIQKINITRYITEDAIKSSATKIIPRNAVLLVTRVGIGKVAITTEELCTSQDFLSIFNLYSNLDLMYIGYSLKKQMIKMNDYSQGSTIKGVTKSELFAQKIFIPVLKEQKKIAGYLAVLDKKVDGVSEQLAKVKSWKQGLLQQMFI